MTYKSVYSLGKEDRSWELKRIEGMSGYESKMRRSLCASPTRWFRLATWC